MKRLLSFLRSRTGRYLIVGGSVYLFELAVIVIAQRLGASSVVAVAISFWAGLLVSFGLQKIITFGDKRYHYKIVGLQLLMVSLLVAWNFMFTVLMTDLLSRYVPAVVCRTAALAITTIWNFYLYKTRIFTIPVESTGLKPKKITTFAAAKTKSKSKAEKNAPVSQRIFLALAFFALLATTIWWTILSAKLNMANADQLVNPYLFGNKTTFHGAEFPGQHSFLIKWPLFFIVSLLHYSPVSLYVMTVSAVLVTVLGLAWVLYRIERRPAQLAILLLALSSVLLMVPPMPYPGGILPVNMAMLETRNIEYIVYVASLGLLLTAKDLLSMRVIAGIGLMTLLIASDKLFLTMALGAAAVALVVYALGQQWRLVTVSVRWLVMTALSAVYATILVLFINITHLTHISQSAAGPYGLVGTPKDLVQGIFYGVLGFFTNLGANPAFDATTIKGIPAAAIHNLFSPAGLAYVVNIVIAVTAVALTVAYLLASWRGKKPWFHRVSVANRLTMMLVWSALISMVLFIISKHDYVVDARYVAICFFAAFALFAVWSRSRRRLPKHIWIVPAVLVISIASGIWSSWHTYQSDIAALAETSQRNDTINQVLAANRQKYTLVGDYWRVVPIKHGSTQNLNIMPLSGCGQLRDVLTSQAWQSDLRHQRFVYLLSLDRSLTDFPQCSLSRVEAMYGPPNSSALIAGTLAKPKELLLFYDSGAHPTNAKQQNAQPSFLPTALASLPNTKCDNPTAMNIVAHQDDDLLFFNPQMLFDIKVDSCIRTVYLTAGDSGSSKIYWLSREQGAEAAYAQMLHTNEPWVQRLVSFGPHQYATVASPKDHPQVSLVFLRLPDGNLRGQGFGASSYESLRKLQSRSIPDAQSVDHQSVYTSNQVVAALTMLMDAYQPDIVRTMSARDGAKIPDHSDHHATGNFATAAFNNYLPTRSSPPTILYYLGYPVREQPQNIFGTDLQAKEAAFFAYAKYDDGVCKSASDCAEAATYGSYLTRSYAVER